MSFRIALLTAAISAADVVVQRGLHQLARKHPRSWQFNSGLAKRPLSAVELSKIDAYRRAANYLSVGQMYLLDNPLLRKEHIKRSVAAQKGEAGRSLS